MPGKEHRGRGEREEGVSVSKEIGIQGLTLQPLSYAIGLLP